MRWFGKSWGAPVCDPKTFVPWPHVPAFCRLCVECGQPIEHDQGGLMVPCLPSGSSGWHLIGYHRGCLFEVLGLPK